MGTRPIDQRGMATLELVLTAPLVMLSILLVIQFGIWQHAAGVTKAAAQEGARLARTDGGDPVAGQMRSYEVLADMGSGVLFLPTVVVTRDDEFADVRIDAQARTLVPGFSLPVRAHVRGPVERFRPEGL